ncbi:MAG: sulfite exporter TauE/SafE family protein [Armatimonadetes bacterium]|nr:sulfite exporter TauE/SafE family protein [Candidatus Hippobium faecium]
MDGFVSSFSELLQENYVIGALISFLVGAFVAFSPCSLSKIPLVIAYVGNVKGDSLKTDFWLSLVFTVGSALIYTVLGVAASLLGAGFLGNRIIYIFLGAVMLVMAVQISGLFNFIPTFDISGRNRKKGFLGAFIAGIFGGIAVTPCATPFLAVILSVLAYEQNVTYGAVLMLMYSLGNGILTLVAGTCTGFVRRLSENPGYARADRIIRIIFAFVLLAIGGYFIYLCV